MSGPDLKPVDISLLGRCRNVAAENHTFYGDIYDRVWSRFDNEIVGRVMAQKKEFINVIDTLLSSQVGATAAEIPITERMKEAASSYVTRGSADVSEIIVDMIQVEESRFESAIDRSIHQLSDPKTIEVLTHHRDAAHIAKAAMLETMLK